MKQIQSDIQNGTFQSVYLLYGDESFLIQEYKRNLLHALVKSEDDMNFSRFEGRGLSETDIIDQAETMPFFAERRVILVEDSGFFQKKAELLASYMDRLPSYLVLIFAEQEADKRQRMFKQVKKYGHAAEFTKQSSEVIMKWVLGRIAKEGKKIRRPDMELFLSYAGEDLSRVNMELEKLLCYTMSREVIERADILEICTPELKNRIFELVRAVSAHNQSEALSCYYDLLALKEAPMRILYLLAREFRMILHVKSLQSEGKDRQSIASMLGIPPFAVDKYKPLCRQYTYEQLERAVSDMVQTEEAVKTGLLSDVLSVELMLVKYSSK